MEYILGIEGSQGYGHILGAHGVDLLPQLFSRKMGAGGYQKGPAGCK